MPVMTAAYWRKLAEHSDAGDYRDFDIRAVNQVDAKQRIEGRAEARYVREPRMSIRVGDEQHAKRLRTLLGYGTASV